MASPSRSTFHSVQIPKPLAAVILFLTLLLSLWGTAATASAHDVLESTSPSSGASVAAMPGDVTLTLDNTPAAIGSKVEVKDASGTDWATGTVSVVDKVASQQIKPGAPAGDYTVNWRLVSSDGHPIEGTFKFTSTGVQNGGAVINTQPADSSPSAEAPVVQQTSQGFPWTIVIVIAVVVLLVAGLIVFARRKLSQNDQD